MYFLCLILTGSSNLYCSDNACTSCLNNLILYNSVLCIERCPYPNLSTKNPCVLSSASLLSLNFNDVKDFTATSYKMFQNPSNLPFNDVSQSTPLPTFDQGFYFATSSHISAVITDVIAPDIKFFLLGLYKEEGEIMDLSYNSVSFIKVSIINSQIVFEILLWGELGPEIFTFNCAFSSIVTWMNIWMTLTHSSISVLDIKYGNRFEQKTNTIVGKEFRPDQNDALLTLGSKNSLSFRGFLFQFNFNLGNTKEFYIETFRKTCLCDFNQYCSEDETCIDCNQSCSNSWPWCTRENCSPCYLSTCSSCDGYSYNNCTSCTNQIYSSPDCSCAPYCLTCSTTFTCTDCEGEYILIENLCIYIPYESDPSTNLLTDYVFSNFEQYKFSVFQSGSNSATYYPLNPEEDDPIILSNRGAYFTKGSFFISKSDFILNYQFSIAYYISGADVDIIDFGELVLGTRGKLTIKLTGVERNIKIRFDTTYFYYNWNFQAVFAKFENEITTIEMMFDDYVIETYSIEGYYYIQGKDQVKIGSDGLMIYSLIIYQKYQTIDSSFRKSDYKNICAYNQYQNDYLGKCKNCDSDYCDNFGTGHYCKYVECGTCDDRDADCVKGIKTYCFDGYLYFDGKCCNPLCKGCFDSHRFSCLACYDSKLLLGYTCVSSCPVGFDISDGNCIQNSTLVAHISFNHNFLSFSDETKNIKVQSGNQSTNYPNLYKSHPIPVYSRGFYFRSTSYITTSEIKMNYNLTFFFIFNIQNKGIFFTSNDFLFYMTVEGLFIIEDRALKKTNLFNCLSLNKWFVFYIKMTGSIQNTLLVEFKSVGMYVYGTFYSQIFTDAVTNIVFGDSVGSFLGFLYEFKLYNSVLDLTSSIDVCKSGTDSNCFMNCDLNQVLVNSNCESCNNCEFGCRNKDKCSICLHPLCHVCSLVDDSCYLCKENSDVDGLTGQCACNYGFYFDSLTESCVKCLNNCAGCSSSTTCLCLENAHSENLFCVCDPGYYLSPSGNCSNCHQSCNTCTDFQYFRCSSCADYLLLTICLKICPHGFIEKDNICQRQTEDVIQIEFNNTFNIYNEKLKITNQGSVASFMRGRYFANSNYLKIESNYERPLIGFQFSIFFWIKISDFGTVLNIEEEEFGILEFVVDKYGLSYSVLLDKKGC